MAQFVVFWGGVVLCLRGHVFLSWSVLLKQMEQTNTTNKQGSPAPTTQHQHQTRSKSYPMLPCCELSQSVDLEMKHVLQIRMQMRIKQPWLLYAQGNIMLFYRSIACHIITCFISCISNMAFTYCISFHFILNNVTSFYIFYHVRCYHIICFTSYPFISYHKIS